MSTSRRPAKRRLQAATSAPLPVYPSEVVPMSASAPGVKRPKLAILLPSSDVVKAEFALHLAGISAYSVSHCELAILTERSSMITRARNSLAQRSLDIVGGAAEFTLAIDSDMTFPADAAVRLMKHDKDICCATYNKRVAPYETLGKLEGEMRDVSAGGLHKALYMPGGFMMIKTKVFRELEWPWFFETYNETEFSDKMMSEDYNFCRKARNAGFEIWCDIDLSYQLSHIGEQAVKLGRESVAAQGGVASAPTMPPPSQGPMPLNQPVMAAWPRGGVMRLA